MFQSFWKLYFLICFIALDGRRWLEAAATVTPLETSTFNCSQPPKFYNFDISKCCRLPAINMSSAIEKCHKHIQTYKSYDAKYPAFTHLCYPECIYRETNTLKSDGDIHIKNVEKFLTMNVEQRDKIIVATIVESFRACLTSIKRNMLAKGIATFATSTEFGCSPYSSMVYGCVNAETFLHCPPEMWQQNESSCNLAKQFAQHCNPLPHVAVAPL